MGGTMFVGPFPFLNFTSGGLINFRYEGFFERNELILSFDKPYLLFKSFFVIC